MILATKDIEQLFNERYQLDLSAYDPVFFKKILSTRLQQTQCADETVYMKLIMNNAVEQVIFTENLLNSYSEFYRNSLIFSVLEHSVLPKLNHFGNKQQEIRIWSAGCAAGQEPYSIAILIDHFKQLKSLTRKIRIFATDISAKNVLKAKSGLYDKNNLKKLPLGYFETYFKQNGQQFEIEKHIKQMVSFSFHNLLSTKTTSPPESVYGDFDIVMCSNVLIYYKPEIQLHILNLLKNSLVSGGFLIVGETEMGIVSKINGLKQMIPSCSVYVKTH